MEILFKKKKTKKRILYYFEWGFHFHSCVWNTTEMNVNRKAQLLIGLDIFLGKEKNVKKLLIILFAFFY